MNTFTPRKLFSSLKIIILGLVLAVGIQYLYAFTSPPGAPAGCPTGYPGCDAPVNVGPSAQTKVGPLIVNGSTTAQASVGFEAWGQSIFNNTGGTAPSAIQIIDGNQGAGKVLTSDANGNGTWETPSSGGASGMTFTQKPVTIYYGSPVTDSNSGFAINCGAGQVVTGVAVQSQNSGDNVTGQITCSTLDYTAPSPSTLNYSSLACHYSSTLITSGPYTGDDHDIYTFSGPASGGVSPYTYTFALPNYSGGWSTSASVPGTLPASGGYYLTKSQEVGALISVASANGQTGQVGCVTP